MDAILWCYHSSEPSSAVLSHGTIYLVRSSNSWVCEWNPMMLAFKWNLFSIAFSWYYLIVVLLPFEFLDEILWCDHSNETSSAVLSHGTIYLVCSSNFWICGCNPVGWPFKWNVFFKCLWKQICNLSIPSDLCEAVLVNGYTALLSQADEISP